MDNGGAPEAPGNGPDSMCEHDRAVVDTDDSVTSSDPPILMPESESTSESTESGSAGESTDPTSEPPDFVSESESTGSMLDSDSGTSEVQLGDPRSTEAGGARVDRSEMNVIIGITDSSD